MYAVDNGLGPSTAKLISRPLRVSCAAASPIKLRLLVRGQAAQPMLMITGEKYMFLEPRTLWQKAADYIVRLEQEVQTFRTEFRACIRDDVAATRGTGP